MLQPVENKAAARQNRGRTSIYVEQHGSHKQLHLFWGS